MSSPYHNFPETRAKRGVEMQNRVFEQKKELINRNMGTSMRALDRECAELRKKKDELDHAKHHSHFLSTPQDNRVISRSFHGTAGHSRVNLSAASNRQLQQIYGAGSAKSTENRKVCFEKSQHKMAIPGTSTGPEGRSQHRLTGSTPGNPASKGKGKVKSSQKGSPSEKEELRKQDSDKHVVGKKSKTRTTAGGGSDYKNLTASERISDHQHHGHHDDRHHGHRDDHHHGNHDDHHHGHHDDPSRHHHGHHNHHDDASHHVSDGHGGHTSSRYTREDVEEQQKVLDLFIHLVEKVDDAVFDPADLKAKLKLSTQTSATHHSTPTEKTKEKHHHHSGHTGPPGVLQRPPLPHLARLSEDPALLKDLEEMLEENKRLTKRKSRELDHTASRDSFSSSKTSLTKGKRRMSNLDMLADILEAYKAQYKEVHFDPLEMLNCGYLRLSKSNVEELERMCREKGIDPGLHAHSDVNEFRLFDDREDPEGEAAAAGITVQKQGLERKTGPHHEIHVTNAKPK